MPVKIACIIVRDSTSAMTSDNVWGGCTEMHAGGYGMEEYSCNKMHAIFLVHIHAIWSLHAVRFGDIGSQFCIRRHSEANCISPVDLGHMHLSACGRRRKPPQRKKKMMTVVSCQLCVHCPGDISECGTCHLSMCASCMPLQSCTLDVLYDCHVIVDMYIQVQGRISQIISNISTVPLAALSCCTEVIGGFW